jgi:predicted DNA-binding protein (MmcQ/YjbR family)
MVHHPAFRLGKKPFAIVGMNEHLEGPTVSINLGPDGQSVLLGDARFARTPYIGQHGWVTVGFAALSAAELKQLVVDSYRRIAGKKQLAALDGAQSSSPKKKAPPRAAASPKRAKAKLRFAK